MKILILIGSIVLILIGAWFIYRVYKYPSPEGEDYISADFRGYLGGIAFILIGILLLLHKVFEVIGQSHPVVTPFLP